MINDEKKTEINDNVVNEEFRVANFSGYSMFHVNGCEKLNVNFFRFNFHSHFLSTSSWSTFLTEHSWQPEPAVRLSHENSSWSSSIHIFTRDWEIKAHHEIAIDSPSKIKVLPGEFHTKNLRHSLFAAWKNHAIKSLLGAPTFVDSQGFSTRQTSAPSLHSNRKNERNLCLLFKARRGCMWESSRVLYLLALPIIKSLILSFISTRDKSVVEFSLLLPATYIHPPTQLNGCRVSWHFVSIYKFHTVVVSPRSHHRRWLMKRAQIWQTIFKQTLLIVFLFWRNQILFSGCCARVKEKTLSQS